VNAVPVICAVAAVPAAWLSGLLIDRIPERQALRPFPPLRVHGRYLAVLLVTLALYVGVGLRFSQESWLLIVGYLLLAGTLVTVSAVDIDCFRLPDRIVLPSLAISIVLILVASVVEGHAARWLYAVSGAAIYFGILLVFHLISPRGMGFGDVKLAAVMGLYLGWLALGAGTAFVLVLWALLVAAVVASLIGAALLVVQGRSHRTPIPFGPYLALGTMLVVLLTPHLVNFTLGA
jgi:leader peptidase (prepilin peptidase)/N-methyltransferase